VLTFDDGYANNLSVAAPVLAEFAFPATVFLATDYVGRGGMFWWDELQVRLADLDGQSLDVAGWGRVDLTSATGVARAVARGEQLLRAAGRDERERLLASLAAASGGSSRAPPLDAVRPATWEECRGSPSLIRFGGHGASHRLLDEIEPDAARADVERCAKALRAELGDRASPTFCYPAGRWTPGVRSSLGAAGFAGAVLASETPARDGLASGMDDPTLLPRVGVSSRVTLPVFAGSVAGLQILLGRLMP
jgi:peptidoglycan/xylan/chitin deacetylase (PgdA/CDA1 family)